MLLGEIIDKQDRKDDQQESKMIVPSRYCCMRRGKKSYRDHVRRGVER
jgi:hypothetical protein